MKTAPVASRLPFLGKERGGVRLILLGPPGAGKGTQGQALALRFGVPHVATGDIIRDHVARRTEFGCKVAAAIAAGNFVADEDILYWVGQRLAQPDSQTGYILDGFPRDLAQARAFGADLDAVVDLQIADDALIERLAGRLVCPTCDEVYHVVYHLPLRSGICDRDETPLQRRPDDEPESIRQRMRVYHELTEPLQTYYQSLDLLVCVDAQGTAADVTRRIFDRLSTRPLANHGF